LEISGAGSTLGSNSRMSPLTNRTRLSLGFCALLLFLAGYQIGVQWNRDLYLQLAPAQFVRITQGIYTGTIIDVMYFRVRGLSWSLLFASAPLAVLISGAQTRWVRRMLVYFAGGIVITLTVSLAARWRPQLLFEPAAGIFFLPLYGAGAVLLHAILARIWQRAP